MSEVSEFEVLVNLGIHLYILFSYKTTTNSILCFILIHVLYFLTFRMQNKEENKIDIKRKKEKKRKLSEFK
jgi:hypothetical protein